MKEVDYIIINNILILAFIIHTKKAIISILLKNFIKDRRIFYFIPGKTKNIEPKSRTIVFIKEKNLKVN